MNDAIKSIDRYTHQKPVLSNKQIILREMSIEDVEDLKEWMPDESLYTFWGKKPGKKDKNPELMFQSLKSVKSFHWGIEEVKSKKVIGDYYLYLIENNRMAKISYRVSKEFQKQEIASLATKMVLDFIFNETELQRVWTEVDIRNTASESVLVRNNFTCEGMIRQGKMVNTYCDYYIYAILKEDYKSSTTI